MSQILVVDDDPAFLHRMTTLLSAAGHTVLSARDGIQALKLIGECKDTLSLVIVDLSLPKTSGFEVIGTVNRRAPHIRILATSGVYKEPYLESAVEIGAHSAIPKPANAAEWLSAVQSALAMRAGS
jgi:DNA-binding NtrC family response regulator